VRTERAIHAIVLEPDRAGGVTRASASWLALRTVRALARIDIASIVARDASHLADLLEATTTTPATSPTWLLRAGAVPLDLPRMPPASATGRALVAFGATDGDAAWTSLLASTGGELEGAAAPLPAICSVFSHRPELLAAAVAGTVPPGARAVRIPSFDVAFSEAPRVVELVTTLHRGGAERIVLDLARELEALGVGVTLAVLDRASRTTFDAPAGTVFLDELARDRRERLEALSDLAVGQGVDVIHAHLVNGDDLRLLRRSGLPIVTTIHNSRPGWPVRLEALGRGDVAMAIACSRDVERQLVEAGFPAVIRTIWNGIAKANANANAKANANANAKAKANAIALLVIANHRPQKRLERLPGIVAELRARGYDARLTVVGEPVKSDPDMIAIEGLVRAEAERLGVADAMELAGSRADVGSLYDACDVVVSTSAFEGLSLVHLEALAAGVPLVTTAVAGSDELRRKHPHAHVVPLDASASVLADAILAAREPARELEAPRTESLAPDFTAKKMAERHAELFARVLATSSPARRRGGLVLVANNFSTGGAQSSARRLLTTLASRGVPVRAIVLQEQAAFPTPGRSALTKAGIDVIVAPRAGDVDPLVTARAIARTVDELEPDALLFWNAISQHKVLVADLLLDTPIWDVSPGEMYFASFEKYLAKPRAGSPYLTMRDYGRRLSGAIVKYEAERTRAEEALGVTVHVVPNGVIVPPLHARRERAERAEHAEHADRVVVGTLARLGVDKKLEQLVDAVAHAHRRGLFEKCELRIAGGVETGDDAYVDELRERARGLPITWVGEQDSATFLAELDLFAMVSEPSGCPNASIEAMAAGLAVVATDVGGARDQIVDGETGLLVPRGDSAALGEAIAELVRDPERRAAMGRAAHARALEKYDVARMADDYARICLGIAPPPASRRDAPTTKPSRDLGDPEGTGQGTRVHVTTTSV
jgi:glycosyltransferase involved in cell wall biosynthesis